MLFVIITVISAILFYDALVPETAFALEKCLTTIIPSLYGSMIIACLVTESRLHAVIGRIFSLPARYIFKMPPEIFSVFILSNISGYPAGAKLLKNMRDKGEISSDEFDRYCCFCYSAGPAFVSGAAASHLFGSLDTGVIIFLSNLTANIISAFISGTYHAVPEISKEKVKCRCDCTTVINSVNSASYGIMQMCTVIVAFSVFKVMITETGAAGALAEFISHFTSLSRENSLAAVLSFTEITNISGFSGYSISVVPLMSALFSTGGICVIMQIFSIAEGRINKIRFLIYRLFGAVSSYAVCTVLYRIFMKNAAVTASSFELYSSENSVIPSVLIIIMSIMMISYDKHRSDLKISFKRIFLLLQR